jgi:hypothetical protein
MGDDNSTAVQAAPDVSDLPADSRGGNLAAAISSDSPGFEALASPAPEPSSTGGGIGVSSDASVQAPRTVPNVTQASGPQAPQEPLKGLGGRLRGVLYGLATGGAIGGIEGAVAPNQVRDAFQDRVAVRKAQVSAAQSEAQFESVKAADMAIQSSNRAQQIDLLNQESRARIRQMNDAHAEYMLNTFGIAPDITLEGNGQEVHDQATAALHTLAGENGGNIPVVSTLVHPHDDSNPQFKVNVFAPSQTDLQRNQQGSRKLVDTERTIKGLAPVDDLTWNSGGGKGYQGQREMVADAMQFLSPVQPFTEQDIGWKLAQRKQLLDAYKQHQNQNGTPDADPATVSALSKSVDFLQKAQDDITASKAAQQAKQTELETLAKAAQAVAIEKATGPIKLAQSRAEEAIKDGDPKAAGQLLVNGDVAPSQLVSSRKPAFAQAAFTAAKQIDPSWNSQAAEGYFSAAKSPANLAFFGSAKSLTDQGGTLDQLQEAYNKLPNGQFPIFNKIADWTAAAAGSGPVAGFASTALGVADDAAKVQGGGAGSDTSREQVLKTFAMSHSPQAMASAINATRRAVDSQMASRIGQNPVMKRMYGDQLLIHVKDQKGTDYVFRTQAQADGFKKEMGIQ